MKLSIDIAEVPAMDIFYEQMTTLRDGEGKAIGKMDDAHCEKVKQKLSGQIVFQARLSEHTLKGIQFLSSGVSSEDHRKEALENLMKEVVNSAAKLLKHPGYKQESEAPEEKSLIVLPGKQPPNRISHGRF